MNSHMIFIILYLGKDSKDKAYKLSADYPFRTNAVKAVLSIAQSVNTQNYVDVSIV